jgi:O-acetyl-ADP-ribose deacetylase (regulator of RNase III)
MDGGVSGALRRACAPADVVRQPKRWWDDLGAERSSIKLPSTQAGIQPAAGGLLERGVQHIVHAVGPTWTDYPIAEKTFGIVQPQIRRTVRRALTAAESVGARSVALPAVSGGIFTHWKEGSDIHEREQREARRAVLQAVFRWAEKKASDNAAASAGDAAPSSAVAAAAAESSTSSAAPMPAASSSLTEIFVCDLPRRSRGAVHLFIEEWDALIAAASLLTMRLQFVLLSPTLHLPRRMTLMSMEALLPLRAESTKQRA